MYQMTIEKNKIGISLRIVNSNTYPETRDALSHDWAKFLENIGMIPIFIPNNLSNLESFLDQTQINGLILSGGDNIGDYPIRDSTEKKILNYGITNDIPIFGVCRGMQLINNNFGGSIKIDQKKLHVGKKHVVNLLDKKLISVLNSNSITVNSYHNNIITKDLLGKNLESTSVVDDDTIESFKHKIHKIFAVMWHPERENNVINKNLIKYIFCNNFHD